MHKWVTGVTVVAALVSLLLAGCGGTGESVGQWAAFTPEVAAVTAPQQEQFAFDMAARTVGAFNEGPEGVIMLTFGNAPALMNLLVAYLEDLVGPLFGALQADSPRGKFLDLLALMGQGAQQGLPARLAQAGPVNFEWTDPEYNIHWVGRTEGAGVDTRLVATGEGPLTDCQVHLSLQFALGYGLKLQGDLAGTLAGEVFQYDFENDRWDEHSGQAQGEGNLRLEVQAANLEGGQFTGHVDNDLAYRLDGLGPSQGEPVFEVVSAQAGVTDFKGAWQLGEGAGAFSLTGGGVYHLGSMVEDHLFWGRHEWEGSLNSAESSPSALSLQDQTEMSNGWTSTLNVDSETEVTGNLDDSQLPLLGVFGGRLADESAGLTWRDSSFEPFPWFH